MAKFTPSLMSGIIGKFANAVGYIWKGKYVTRAYVANVPDPRTEPQLLQRAKFGSIAQLAGRMYDALFLGLRSFANGKKNTVLGEFERLNKNATEGATPEAVEISYDAVTISRGSCPEVVFGDASFATPQQVSVPIDDGNAGARKSRTTDKVYLAAYCPDKGQCILSDGTATRSSQNVTITFPTTWQGMKAHVWGFVFSPVTGEASTSFYAGNGTVS